MKCFSKRYFLRSSLFSPSPSTNFVLLLISLEASSVELGLIFYLRNFFLADYPSPKESSEMSIVQCNFGLGLRASVWTDLFSFQGVCDLYKPGKCFASFLHLHSIRCRIPLFLMGVVFSNLSPHSCLFSVLSLVASLRYCKRFVFLVSEFP